MVVEVKMLHTAGAGGSGGLFDGGDGVGAPSGDLEITKAVMEQVAPVGGGGGGTVGNR